MFNPYPIPPENWSEQSISVHKIKPSDIINKSLIENGIQVLYRLITLDKKFHAIVGAFNTPFDKSRITSCVEKMLPNFECYDVTWVDTR
jgi:hypothetical protein